MKRHSVLLCLILLSVILSGCASSKRMRRLSAGVAGDYSIPEQQYIRSKKYQDIERKSIGMRYGGSLPTRGGKTDAKIPKPLELNENLVNLWPFYFHSGQYTSMLWPLIDWDPYGFAFRPFYNHEGDDYSILFPLCGWNTEAHDGWCLTAFWDKDGWCVLPFAVWHPEWGYLVLPLAFKSGDKDVGRCMVTPLYWHSWRYGHATPNQPYTCIDDRFWLVALAYYDRDVRKDLRGYEYLFPCSNWSDALAKELAYRMADGKHKVPTSQKELDELKEKIFFAQPDAFCLKYGLFPFFHVSSTPDSSSFNILWPLFYTRSNSKTNSRTFSLLGWFGAYYKKVCHKLAIYNTLLEEDFFISIPLLSAFSSEKYIVTTPETEKLRDIYRLNENEKKYKENLEKIMKLWKVIDPNLKLPPTVCDSKTMRLFLDDYFQKHVKSLKTRYYKWGGCLPLFLYNIDSDSRKWTFPLLLSGYRSNDKHHSWSFWSVPLLSYFKESSTSSKKTVAGPIGWYKTTTTNSPISRTVFSKDTYAPKTNYGLAEVSDTYAACGLYYHGKHSFLIPKVEYEHQTIEIIRGYLNSLPNLQSRLDNSTKNLEQRRIRCSQMDTSTRINELKQLLEIEYIKQDQTQLDAQKLTYETNLQNFRAELAKLGFDCSAELFADDPIVAKARRDNLMLDIINKCTTIRSYEDYGTGFFFHREIYENGDGYWNLLFGLAGGRKQGDTEQTQILQFLYRYTRDGQRSEKLIFPFISVQKDGENVRRSFLWRLWEQHKKDGKSGGHFLFIPYGD